MAAIATEPWRRVVVAPPTSTRHADLTGAAGLGGGRVGVGEVGRQVLQQDAVLRASRPGQRRRDRTKVQHEGLIEGGPIARHAPQALGLRIPLDERHAVRGPAGEPEVGEGLVIDREEGGRRPELGAHVADRRPVRQRQPGQPVPGELDERPDDAVGAQHLGDDQDEVRRRRAAWQLAGQADAHDMGHRLVQRLAEQDRLRFDATDAVAQDAQPVDHRRVRIGPDERVREGDPAAGAVRSVRDDGRQEFEVDLVDDARSRWHDPQVAEGGLRPAQELVALAVALVFALDVERERAGRPEPVDLDGMIDDEVCRHERVHRRRITAQVRHGVAHDREVHDRRDAGEVLEDHPGGMNGISASTARPPARTPGSSRRLRSRPRHRRAAAGSPAGS